MPAANQHTPLAQDARLAAIHRCAPEQTALIVVDMQHGFLDAGASLEVPPGREIIPNLRRLVAACRAGGVPVIFIVSLVTSAPTDGSWKASTILESRPGARNRAAWFGVHALACFGIRTP